MSPLDQAFVPILGVAVVVMAACFLIAWLDIAIHHKSESHPSEKEMRRYMLCGFYCNPDDSRPVVHRPFGRGYTINLRHENLVVTLVVMTALAALVAALIYTIPAE